MKTNTSPSAELSSGTRPVPPLSSTSPSCAPPINRTKARYRLLKAASCVAVAILATGLAGCPQKNTSDADAKAQLQAEVARLKAEADANAKGQTDAAVAQAQAAQAAAAANAQSAANAQAQTAADVASAEAEVAKAQAEADEAAKSAAAAQTSFVDAQGEAEKAKEVVDQAKTEAEASQEAAAAPTATEADVAKAEADANELAVEVAQAEAARLRAELARAKAKAAAVPIRGPISPTSKFLNFLSTLLNNQTGGSAYALTGSGQIWVPPGAVGSGSGSFMMNQFPPPTQQGIVQGIGGGRNVIASAQLTPSPATFSPPVQVTFDLTAGPPMSPPATVGQMIEVMEFDTVSHPSKGWVSRNPAVWAQVQPDTRFAVATMSHFCTVALVAPKPGDPRVPQPGPQAEMHPTEKEAIAKANAEAKAEAARNKQLAETYKAAAKTARVALVTRIQKQGKVAAKEAADEKAKAAAERRIEDLKERKAKALAETKAIERENRHARAQADRAARAQEERESQQRQQDQWQARQQMHQLQQQQQEAQQNQRQVQPQQQPEEQQEKQQKRKKNKKKNKQQQGENPNFPDEG